MARIEKFERELRVATSGLSSAAIAAELARVAHEALDEAIDGGDASEHYQRFVNGKEGAPEESVIPPGPIVYVFDYQAEIAAFALDWARENSPVESGAYRDAWFAMVDGQQVDAEEIPDGAQVTITNDRPYARKIEVGSIKVRIPPGIVERMRSAVIAEFGPIVSAEISFIQLEGGYILKRNGGRRGRHAGDSITYPALILSPP